MYSATDKSTGPGEAGENKNIKSSCLSRNEEIHFSCTCSGFLYNSETKIKCERLINVLYTETINTVWKV